MVCPEMRVSFACPNAATRRTNPIKIIIFIFFITTINFDGVAKKLQYVIL